MTELVEPSPGEAESLPLSGALKNAFGDGWIVPSDTDLYASDTGAAGTPLDAFGIDASGSSLTVDIRSGEAFVDGKYLWKDEPTSVDLPANDTVTIYVGWPAQSGNDVRIDHPEGDNFPAGAHGALPIWTVDTDSSGVTDTTSDRLLGAPITHSAEDGQVNIQTDTTVGDNTIYTSNSGGDSGFSPQSGIQYTQFNDWATIYAYSGDGNEGIRFRNPDGPGDLWRIDTNGEAVLTGGLNIGGDFVNDGDFTTGNVNVTDDLLTFTTDASAYIRGDHELDGDAGHFLGTLSDGAGHMPWIIRSTSTNTAIFDAGDVTIPNGKLTISAAGDNEPLLELDMDRPWNFYQRGTGGSTSLALKSESANKSFWIENSSEVRVIQFRSTSDPTGAFIDVPEGEVRMRGDPVIRETSSWDGTSMTMETADGTQIELIRED